MFKKLAALAGAGAMLLSIATPAFAHSVRNRANVTQVTSSSALTGDNYQGNSATVKKAHVGGEVEVKGDNSLTTKKAESSAVGVVAANTNVNADCCGPTARRQKNSAKVIQTTVSSASSGNNIQGNDVSVKKAGVDGDVEVKGDNTLTAGKAESSATGVVVVNTQVSLD